MKKKITATSSWPLLRDFVEFTVPEVTNALGGDGPFGSRPPPRRPVAFDFSLPSFLTFPFTSSFSWNVSFSLCPLRLPCQLVADILKIASVFFHFHAIYIHPGQPCSHTDHHLQTTNPKYRRRFKLALFKVQTHPLGVYKILLPGSVLNQLR